MSGAFMLALCRSAFEDRNLLWSDMTAQAASLPDNFPRKPEVVYAEKDTTGVTLLALQVGGKICIFFL